MSIFEMPRLCGSLRNRCDRAWGGALVQQGLHMIDWEGATRVDGLVPSVRIVYLYHYFPIDVDTLYMLSCLRCVYE